MIRVSLVAALLAGSTIVASPDDSWSQYPCADGSLAVASAVYTYGQASDLVSVLLPGELACGVPDPGPRFGVAVYEPGTDVGRIDREGGLYPYRYPDGPTRFTLSGGVRIGQVLRLCLVTDYDTRVVCVGFASAGNEVKAFPVETSDPAVQLPTALVTYADNPLCGTCWTVIKD
jgi:hypothetical protein